MFTTRKQRSSLTFSFTVSLSLSLPVSHKHTHSLSPSHKHTHTFSLSLTTVSLSLPVSQTNALSLSLSLSLSLTHTHTHTHTHTQTHTHTHSLSLLPPSLSLLLSTQLASTWLSHSIHFIRPTALSSATSAFRANFASFLCCSFCALPSFSVDGASYAIARCLAKQTRLGDTDPRANENTQRSLKQKTALGLPGAISPAFTTNWLPFAPVPTRLNVVIL